MDKQTPKTQYTHDVTTVTITRDVKLQPFIDTFSIIPQNVIEKAHGSLVGFFRIYDHGTDTAYIANFLTSVIKKEYYATTRRSSEDALEAALTKINATLAEMVAREEITWLDKLDGAIVAITAQDIYFSVCGHSIINLYRNNRLTTISEGLASPTINPLSVFSDIASGKLHDGDRFFIASHELNDIIPPDELQTACNRYAGKDLEQFIHTALVNHADVACTHIVDITPEKSAITKRAATIDMETEHIVLPENAFSANTYTNTDTQQNATDSAEEDHSTNTQKTGHIYLRGQEEDTQTPPITEIINEHFAQIRSFTKKQSSVLWQACKNGFAHITTGAKNHYTALQPKVSHALTAGKNTLRSSAQTTATHATRIARSTFQQLRTLIAQRKSNTSPKNAPSETTDTPTQQSTAVQFMQRIQQKTLSDISPSQNTPKESTVVSHSESSPETSPKVTQKISKETPAPVVPQHPSPTQSSATRDRIDKFLAHSPKPSLPSSTTFSEKLSSLTAQAQKIPSYLYALLPNKTRLLATARRLSKKQWFTAVGILLAILIIPLVIMRIRTPHSAPQPVPVPVVDNTPEEAPHDKSSVAIERMHTISMDTTTDTILSLRKKLFSVSAETITQITNAQKKESFTMPSTYGKIRHSVAMDDLNILLLFTDKDMVISFSPQSKKFTRNKITLPAGIHVDAMGTYLTYLYLIDNNANAIYRYPRASGGFGAARSWLKDDIDINVSDIIIDGTIYAIEHGGAIRTFFRNKATTWQSPTVTPVLHATALFTSSEDAPLYVLDAENARIIGINKKTHQTTTNLTNDDFRRAHKIIVDERTKIITLLLDDNTITTYRF